MGLSLPLPRLQAPRNGQSCRSQLRIVTASLPIWSRLVSRAPARPAPFPDSLRSPSHASNAPTPTYQAARCHSPTARLRPRRPAFFPIATTPPASPAGPIRTTRRLAAPAAGPLVRPPARSQSPTGYSHGGSRQNTFVRAILFAPQAPICSRWRCTLRAAVTIRGLGTSFSNGSPMKGRLLVQGVVPSPVP
jgi:hypothetical protein